MTFQISGEIRPVGLLVSVLKLSWMRRQCRYILFDYKTYSVIAAFVSENIPPRNNKCDGIKACSLLLTTGTQ